MNSFRAIETYKVGEIYRSERHIDDTLVRSFCDVSGDHNKIHLDEAYAKSTRFGGRIAHGALLIACLSKVLGMDFPGPGAIYLSQTVEFLKPVYVGETIEIELEVKSIDLANRVLTLTDRFIKADKTLAATGISQIKLPKTSSL